MVVVTSFDTARRSISLLNNLPWTVLVIDEAHRLKNPHSQSTLAFSSFAWPEDHPVPHHVSRFTESATKVAQRTTTKPGKGTPSLAGRATEPRTGPIRVALTGTAIQNSYLELWTLLDWTNPGAVGGVSQWKKYVMNPLIAGQAKESKEEERIHANVRH